MAVSLSLSLSLLQGLEIPAGAHSVRMLGPQAPIPGDGYLLKECYGLCRLARRGQIPGQYVSRTKRVRIVVTENAPAVGQEDPQDRDGLVSVASFTKVNRQELSGPKRVLVIRLQNLGLLGEKTL